MTPGVAPATTGTRTIVPRARARSTPSSRRPVGVVTNPPWRVAPREPDGSRTLWRFPTPLLAALAAPPPALALLETGDGTYLSDLQVAGATSATLALLAVASLASGTRGCAKTLSGLSSELRHRLDHVEPLEVRLDVTTLWCFVLARDLCTPPPGGWHLSLGFDAQDVERIFRVVASGAELTLFWLACGLVAGQFTRDARRVAEFNGEPYVVEKNGSNDTIGEELKLYLRPGWQVAFAAGTAWQIAEAYSDAYVSAAANASIFLLDDPALLAPAACVDAASALPSVLALAAAMQTYRLFSFYVP